MVAAAGKLLAVVADVDFEVVSWYKLRGDVWSVVADPVARYPPPDACYPQLQIQ